MTDAPELSMHDSAERDADDQGRPDWIAPFAATWRAELSGQISVSASGVQDRLLDLWGDLPAGDSRTEVERWITETLGRHLYEVADIEHRLEGLVATDAAPAPEPSNAG